MQIHQYIQESKQFGPLDFSAASLWEKKPAHRFHYFLCEIHQLVDLMFYIHFNFLFTFSMSEGSL